MNRRRWTGTVALLGLAVAVTAGWLYRSTADEQPTNERSSEPEVAAVRKSAEAFATAFNQGDAKAVAAFWTANGEYIGPDGEPIRGREAVAKEYAEFFKKNPKARVEVEIESIRLLGRYTALEEGTLKLILPGEKEPGVSRYSVLHVREDDAWRMASVREWIPDPADLVSPKSLEWLIGQWSAKSEDAELHVRYAWDEDKVYLHGRYTLKRGGKTSSSGLQIIGKNPGGGLRSWHFDSSGVFGESVWMPEEGRWIIEAVGTLPDGSEVSAVNLFVPLGKDSFTWQSVERTVAGTEMPAAPPVKVTRVKTEK